MYAPVVLGVRTRSALKQWKQPVNFPASMAMGTAIAPKQRFKILAGTPSGPAPQFSRSPLRTLRTARARTEGNHSVGGRQGQAHENSCSPPQQASQILLKNMPGTNWPCPLRSTPILLQVTAVGESRSPACFVAVACCKESTIFLKTLSTT